MAGDDPTTHPRHTTTTTTTSPPPSTPPPHLYYHHHNHQLSKTSTTGGDVSPPRQDAPGHHYHNHDRSHHHHNDSRATTSDPRRPRTGGREIENDATRNDRRLNDKLQLNGPLRGDDRPPTTTTTPLEIDVNGVPSTYGPSKALHNNTLPQENGSDTLRSLDSVPWNLDGTQTIIENGARLTIENVAKLAIENVNKLAIENGTKPGIEKGGKLGAKDGNLLAEDTGSEPQSLEEELKKHREENKRLKAALGEAAEVNGQWRLYHDERQNYVQRLLTTIHELQHTQPPAHSPRQDGEGSGGGGAAEGEVRRLREATVQMQAEHNEHVELLEMQVRAHRDDWEAERSEKHAAQTSLAEAEARTALLLQELQLLQAKLADAESKRGVCWRCMLPRTDFSNRSSRGSSASRSAQVSPQPQPNAPPTSPPAAPSAPLFGPTLAPPMAPTAPSAPPLAPSAPTAAPAPPPPNEAPPVPLKGWIPVSMLHQIAFSGATPQHQSPVVHAPSRAQAATPLHQSPVIHAPSRTQAAMPLHQSPVVHAPSRTQASTRPHAHHQAAAAARAAPAIVKVPDKGHKGASRGEEGRGKGEGGPVEEKKRYEAMGARPKVLGNLGATGSGGKGASIEDERSAKHRARSILASAIPVSPVSSGPPTSITRSPATAATPKGYVPITSTVLTPVSFRQPFVAHKRPSSIKHLGQSRTSPTTRSDPPTTHSPLTPTNPLNPPTANSPLTPTAPVLPCTAQSPLTPTTSFLPPTTQSPLTPTAPVHPLTDALTPAHARVDSIPAAIPATPPGGDAVTSSETTGEWQTNGCSVDHDDNGNTTDKTNNSGNVQTQVKITHSGSAPTRDTAVASQCDNTNTTATPNKTNTTASLTPKGNTSINTIPPTTTSMNIIPTTTSSSTTSITSTITCSPLCTNSSTSNSTPSTSNSTFNSIPCTSNTNSSISKSISASTSNTSSSISNTNSNTFSTSDTTSNTSTRTTTCTSPSYKIYNNVTANTSQDSSMSTAGATTQETPNASSNKTAQNSAGSIPTPNSGPISAPNSGGPTAFTPVSGRSGVVTTTAGESHETKDASGIAGVVACSGKAGMAGNHSEGNDTDCNSGHCGARNGVSCTNGNATAFAAITVTSSGQGVVASSAASTYSSATSSRSSSPGVSLTTFGLNSEGRGIPGAIFFALRPDQNGARSPQPRPAPGVTSPPPDVNGATRGTRPPSGVKSPPVAGGGEHWWSVESPGRAGRSAGAKLVNSTWVRLMGGHANNRQPSGTPWRTARAVSGQQLDMARRAQHDDPTPGTTPNDTPSTTPGATSPMSSTATFTYTPAINSPPSSTLSSASNSATTSPLPVVGPRQQDLKSLASKNIASAIMSYELCANAIATPPPGGGGGGCSDPSKMAGVDGVATLTQRDLVCPSCQMLFPPHTHIAFLDHFEVCRGPEYADL